MWNDACRWARQRLPLFAGGELVGSDRRKAERHLIGCPDCRERLRMLQGSLAALHAVAAEPLPLSDTSSLWPSLARQIRESRRPAPSFWSIFPARPLAWAGMAAALLLIGIPAASRTSSYLQSRKAVRTASATPKPHAAAPAAATAARDADTSVADASISRSEGDYSPSPSPNTPASPRNSPKNPPVNGISTSIEATH